MLALYWMPQDMTGRHLGECLRFLLCRNSCCPSALVCANLGVIGEIMWKKCLHDCVYSKVGKQRELTVKHFNFT